jgi:O-antigen/teichoic acid export membrane protein
VQVIDALKYKFNASSNSYLLLLGNIFQTAIQLFTYSFLSHVLSMELYGNFRQITFLGQLFIVIASLGLGQSMYYFLSKASNAQERSLAWIGHYTIAGLASVFLFVLCIVNGKALQDFFNLESYSLLMIGTAFAFINVLQGLHLNTYLHLKKYPFYFYGQVVLGLAKIGAVLWYYYAQYSIEFIFWAWTILHAISFLIYFIVEYRHILLQRIDIKAIWTSLRPVLVYAIPIGLGTMSGVLMQQTDKWIFTYFDNSSASFAILSNVTFQITFIHGFYTAFSSVAFPKLVQAWKEGLVQDFIQIRNNYIKEVIPWVIPITIGVMFWSEELLNLVFGEVYGTYALYFSIFSSTMLIRVMSFNDTFLALGKSTYMVSIQLIEFIINVILSWVLIWNYGIAGAVWAYTIIVFLYAVVALYLASRVTKTSFSDQAPFSFWFKTIAIFSVWAIVLQSIGAQFEWKGMYWIEMLGFGIFFILYHFNPRLARLLQ